MQTMTATLALMLALATGAAAQEAAPRTITVTGEGMAAVVPDLAWVSLGVSEEATGARDAMTGMATDMTAVMAQLTAAGIAEADIQTGQLTLEPRFDYSSYDGVPKMLGYTATTLVEVRVRDIANLGTVLDAVVAEGANRLGGIRFDVTDRTAVMAAARRAAVADARAQAELFTDAGGVTLGALQTISVSGGYAAPMPMYDMRGGMAMEASAPVPVAAGEVNFTAMVTMVWVIE